MADQLYFSRDSKCFIEMDGVFWTVPVLDGFSFSQANESTEIVLAEMEDSNGTSRRGKRAFNTALSAGEWSFSTYVRPFASSGTGTGVADPSTDVHAVEEVLWALFVGADNYDTTRADFMRGNTGGTNVANTPASAQNQFTLNQSNKSTLGTANIFFVLGDANRTIMKLKDAVVNEATVDFDIDGIATINWSGNCSEVNDVTGSSFEASRDTVVFDAQLNGAVSSGATSFTLDAGHGVTAGMKVFGATGIADDTKVSSVSTNSITIDTATTGAISDDTKLRFMKQTKDGTDIVAGDLIVDTNDSNRLKTFQTVPVTTHLNDAVSSGDTKCITDSLTGVAVGDFIVGGGFPAGSKVETLNPDSDNTNEFESDTAATAAGADNSAITFIREPTAIYEKATATDNFIRNRLSQLTISVSDQDQDNDGTNEFASSYTLTLTGGSISLSNNVTYITPEELGKVNIPFAHVTGNRAIGGSFTCYLTLDTTALDGTGSKSRDLFDDLRNATGVVTNSMDLTFKIGGTSGNRLEFNFPTCHLEVPSHSIEDVISLETNFMALPSAIDQTDEATITYKV